MKKTLTMLLALAMLLAGMSAIAETYLTTTGEGSAILEADRAVVRLGVERQNKSVSQGQSEVNARIAAIREALQTLGVGPEAVALGDVSIYSDYDYSDYSDSFGSAQRYTVSHTIEITLEDAAMVGPAIDAAIGAGANQLFNVRFLASDTSEAYEKALSAAVADARDKSQILADAADLEIVGLDSIKEGGTLFDMYETVTSAETKALSDGVSVPTEIAAGKITVPASVTCVWIAE